MPDQRRYLLYFRGEVLLHEHSECDHKDGVKLLCLQLTDLFPGTEKQRGLNKDREDKTQSHHVYD